MKLKWLGHSCFELTLDGGVLVTDPYDESVGYPPLRVRADAVLSSHDHFDHNHIASVSGEDVTIILQVKQRPIVAVSAQDNVTTTSAIASVRTTIGHILGTVHVHGATPTFTRAAINLHIVNKVAFCHTFL